jgi:hypothetical protein
MKQVKYVPVGFIIGALIAVLVFCRISGESRRERAATVRILTAQNLSSCTYSTRETVCLTQNLGISA